MTVDRINPSTGKQETVRNKSKVINRVTGVLSTVVTTPLASLLLADYNEVLLLLLLGCCVLRLSFRLAFAPAAAPITVTDGRTDERCS